MQVALTKQEPQSWLALAVPALHSLGMAPSQPTFLISKGGGPQTYANSPISVGGYSARLEKDHSILSDPSHDKIALPLQTSALDLWLQFTRLKLSDPLRPCFQKNLKNPGSQIHKTKYFGSKYPTYLHQILLHLTLK
jgi:hypothetical protein